MRRISIGGAVFMFLAPGEKLKDGAALPQNGLPDARYVIWPRREGWDVRYLKRSSWEWVEIAGHRFSNEDAAWLAAYEHWEKISENPYSLNNF